MIFKLERPRADEVDPVGGRVYDRVVLRERLEFDTRVVRARELVHREDEVLLELLVDGLLVLDLLVDRRDEELLDRQRAINLSVAAPAGRK